MSPERLDALNEQSRLFPGQTLPEICMNLRMASNGSADAWSDEDMMATVAMLKARLNTWEWSFMPSAFDDAVKAMVEATLMEVGHGT